MAKKDIIFEEKAWAKLVAGTEKLAKAVGATLGPNGRTVIIQSSFGDPRVTKDGVSVAKEVTLEDEAENLGVKVLTSIANRMSVGDGTTSSIVFSNALIQGARKVIAAGANPNQIIAEMEEAVKTSLSMIEANTIKIDNDPKMIERVATIAANNDEIMGKVISSAYEKVGKNGVILVEESQSGETEVSVIDGMQLDKGYCSPYFITNKDKGTCELSDALVLICDSRISNIPSILKILEAVVRQNKALLIVAEDVDGEALAGLILNKMHGKIKVAAVKAPSFGDRRKEMLQDLAILTGGQVISSDLGITLENAAPEYLGRVSKAVVSKDKTILTVDSKSSLVQERITELENQLKQASSDYDRNKLRERIAYLSQGIAMIKVGGHSSLVVGEAKDRVEDAVNAVQAATNKGIVPGGGALFVHIANKLGCSTTPGSRIFCDALKSITRQIAENSGLSNPAGVIEKLQDKNDPRYGYDAKQGRYGDMIEFGIVDAALVAESVIKNGFDGVRTLITTSVVIVELPEEKSSPSMPDMGMM